MPHAPRPYQSKAIDSLRQNFASGIQRQLLVAPTGAGKTTIAAIVIDGVIRKKKKAWFLAHRRELIDQCSERLDDHRIHHGVIQGKHPRFKPWLPVQVVSVMTALKRLQATSESPPDLIIVDEAHRSLAESYVVILEAFPNAIVIGLTATPWRLDGKPLGDRYDKLVLVATPQELIDLGFLLAPRVFAPNVPDLSGVRKMGGDYKNDDLADRMKTATIVGDIVTHWKDRVQASGNPQTVLFAVNKAHSMILRDRFRDEGIAATHIDESTKASERKHVKQDLSSGQVQVVCNCQILTEGWDMPSLGAVVLARPTKSVALFLQMAGRGMRTHNGKTGWLLMDHAGSVLEHGFPQSDREYSLDKVAVTQKGKEESGPAVTVCEDCFAIYASRIRVCPSCGHERKVQERSIEEDSDAELAELTPKQLEDMKRKKARKIPWVARVARLTDLYEEAEEKEYRKGWANHQFKSIVGVWPPEKMRVQAADRLVMRKKYGVKA